jgi:hypothetical protein
LKGEIYENNLKFLIDKLKSKINSEQRLAMWQEVVCAVPVYQPIQKLEMGYYRSISHFPAYFLYTLLYRHAIFHNYY